MNEFGIHRDPGDTEQPAEQANKQTSEQDASQTSSQNTEQTSARPIPFYAPNFNFIRRGDPEAPNNVPNDEDDGSKFNGGYVYFDDDEFFGEPDEYYELNSPDKAPAIDPEQYPEIYAPSDESIERTIKPFFERVEADMDTLLAIGSKMDILNISEADVQQLISFFSKKFDVATPPSLILYENTDCDCGGYDDDINQIMCGARKTGSVAEIICAIAHETWHAHQFFSDSELYAFNLKNYYKPHVDYDAYKSQIFEKEASSLEDLIGYAYRFADLKAHPDKAQFIYDHVEKRPAEAYATEKELDGLDRKYFDVAIQNHLELNPDITKQ